MNILIVGLGAIATKHIHAIRVRLPQAKVFALRSGKGGQAIEDVTDVFQFDELPGRPDFGIICNPTHMHFDTIRDLTMRNIPLFIEKPAVHTLAGIPQLLEDIEQRQLPNYVACNLRFHPCIRFLKEQLNERQAKINEVNIYCGSYLPDWRPGRAWREMYSACPEQGGGVHLDLFHELDYTCWLWGIPEKKHLVVTHQSSLDIPAADYANYWLGYKGFSVSIVLNYYRRKPKRTIEILFDDTTWTVDLIANTVSDERTGIIATFPDFKILDTYEDQITYFHQLLEDKEKPMNNLTESVDILKIILDNEPT